MQIRVAIWAILPVGILESLYNTCNAQVVAKTLMDSVYCNLGREASINMTGNAPPNVQPLRIFVAVCPTLSGSEILCGFISIYSNEPLIPKCTERVHIP